MIEADDQMPPEQKARHRISLLQLLRFCSNQTDCRRVQVLSHFDETIDSADCGIECDNCLDRETQRRGHFVVDRTRDAVSIIQMIQSFAGQHITVKEAAECFRGSNARSSKPLALNPHFGTGSHWHDAGAEILMGNLVIEGALAMFFVKDTKDTRVFVNGYLKVQRRLICHRLIYRLT